LKEKLLQFDPGLRIIIHVTDILGRFNTPLIPKCLEFFLKWSPCIMYIPGDLWTQAMHDPNFVIREGIFVMNGELVPLNTPEAERPNGFMNSIQACDDKYQFRYVSNGTSNDPDSVLNWLRTCNIASSFPIKCPEE
jgi:hypothetical protein